MVGKWWGRQARGCHQIINHWSPGTQSNPLSTCLEVPSFSTGQQGWWMGCSDWPRSHKLPKRLLLSWPSLKVAKVSISLDLIFTDLYISSSQISTYIFPLYFIFKRDFIQLIIYFRKRESMWVRARAKGEMLQADSLLSVEPHMGLDVRAHEIMTEQKPRIFMFHWLSHPGAPLLYFKDHTEQWKIHVFDLNSDSITYQLFKS